jgi:hypothetical protein
MSDQAARRREPMRWTRLFLVAALVAAAVPALAQRSTATLRGTVADSTGGVVPGATVTAKNAVTGFTRSVTTNANGIYLLQELPVGTYTLTVELAGFKTMSKTGIELNVADVRESEFKLETGAISETVSVVADTLVVKTAAKWPDSSPALRSASCRSTAATSSSSPCSCRA